MNCDRDADRDAYKSTRNGERQRDAEGYRIRAAGVCLRGSGVHTQVLLVSGGKDSEKWVVPGGGVEKGEAAHEAARRELEEEAGVRAIAGECLGIFQDDERKHRTTVFLMLELEELPEWEDARIGRRRNWMSVYDALEKAKSSHVRVLRSVLSRIENKLNV